MGCDADDAEEERGALRARRQHDTVEEQPRSPAEGARQALGEQSRSVRGRASRRPADPRRSRVDRGLARRCARADRRREQRAHSPALRPASLAARRHRRASFSSSIFRALATGNLRVAHEPARRGRGNHPGVADGSRSDDHAAAAANLCSLIASCKLHDIDAETCLAEIVNVLPYWCGRASATSSSHPSTGARRARGSVLTSSPARSVRHRPDARGVRDRVADVGRRELPRRPVCVTPRSPSRTALVQGIPRA